MRNISISVCVFCGLFLFQTLVYGQNEQLLKFTNGEDQAVTDNFYDDITLLNITEREFEATSISVGKANPLGDKLLSKLKSKNREIYDQAQKITTSFELSQGNNKFYIRGFNSINLAPFRNGEFKVKCGIYLIEVRSKGNISWIPIIIAIRKL